MNETVEPTPEDHPRDDNAPAPKRGLVSVAIGVAVLAAVGIAAFIMSAAADKAEAAAAEEIKSLKALAVMDANRKHVGSLNTVTINSDTEKFNRVLELAPALIHLQILDLADSPVTADQLSGISNLTELTTLQLNKTATSDDDLPNFFGMKKLESIYLAETRITNKGLSSVARLSSLTILNVSNNGLTDLAPLTQLPKVIHLVICQESPFTDEDVENLAAMPSLRRLTISPGQLTDEQASKLEKAKSGLSIDSPNIE